MDANARSVVRQLPQAEAAEQLRRRFDATWAHEDLWADNEFENPVASEAQYCIHYLIVLGVNPSELEWYVGGLAKHICGGNRELCAHLLGRYYAWLR